MSILFEDLIGKVIFFLGAFFSNSLATVLSHFVLKMKKKTFLGAGKMANEQKAWIFDPRSNLFVPST